MKVASMVDQLAVDWVDQTAEYLVVLMVALLVFQTVDWKVEKMAVKWVAKMAGM